MTKIEIQNVGPLENVRLDLKKINIFMGPQSSGKSTIAKIISYCQWAEKRYIIDGEFEYEVKEQLQDFHRLSEGYFNDDSLIKYDTEFVEITYRGRDLKSEFKLRSASKSYKKTKNIYIPSERNFVSVIPNLSKYKETNDNIMSFVYDWFSAKRIFTHDNTLSILDLGVDFYNKSENDLDVLILKNKREILLREGSSGLQSIIPLIVLVEYLTSYIYNAPVSISVHEKDSIRKYLLENFEEILNSSFSDLVKKSKPEKISQEDMDRMFKVYRQTLFRETYHSTNLIIEEPEQNLFPATQRALVNYLLIKVNSERDHTLLLTTHSPYILYSLNNAMMGYNVRKQIDEDAKQELESAQSWINPDLVSIWQVEDGDIVSVKDESTKTVTKHYFNEITKDIMDEYYELLSYYEFD